METLINSSNYGHGILHFAEFKINKNKLKEKLYEEFIPKRRKEAALSIITIFIIAISFYLFINDYPTWITLLLLDIQLLILSGLDYYTLATQQINNKTHVFESALFILYMLNIVNLWFNIRHDTYYTLTYIIMFGSLMSIGLFSLKERKTSMKVNEKKNYQLANTYT